MARAVPVPPGERGRVRHFMHGISAARPTCSPARPPRAWLTFRDSGTRRFSILAQRAEREVVKANPPMSKTEAGQLRGKAEAAAPEAVASVDRNLLDKARLAHSHLSTLV